MNFSCLFYIVLVPLKLIYNVKHIVGGNNSCVFCVAGRESRLLRRLLRHRRIVVRIHACCSCLAGFRVSVSHCFTAISKGTKAFEIPAWKSHHATLGRCCDVYDYLRCRWGYTLTLISLSLFLSLSLALSLSLSRTYSVACTRSSRSLKT